MRLVGSYLSSPLGIEPGPPALEAWSSHQLTMREFQDNLFSFSPTLFLSDEFLTLLESHLLNAFPPRHTVFSCRQRS